MSGGILNFKPGMDRAPWRTESPAPTAQSVGTQLLFDMTNDLSMRSRFFHYLRTNTASDKFDPLLGDWTPTMGVGQFPAAGAAGQCAVWHPSRMRLLATTKTIAGGATTTGFTSATSGIAARTNEWAGKKLRVYGLAAGKTETVTVVSNTDAGAPVITFTPALSFTPASGDIWDVLEGVAFSVSTTPAFNYYAQQFVGGIALSATNLIASATDNLLFCMSELYVPNDRNPGDGFVDSGATYNQGNSACILASASSATTITASALTNPATPSLFTNEYRNFQVRIVEDTTTPTAVGQRRNITSHTSGNTPVFTVPTWTVTPSSTAKFVVEMNDDRLILRGSTNTNTYGYSISANAWDTTTWANPGVALANQVVIPSFGITRDPTGFVRQSYFNFINSSFTPPSVLDIAGGATGSFSGNWDVLQPAGTVFPIAGTSYVYDPVCNGGKYSYALVPIANAITRLLRIDCTNGEMRGLEPIMYPAAALTVGSKMALHYAWDGLTKVPILYVMVPGQAAFFSKILPYS